MGDPWDPQRMMEESEECLGYGDSWDILGVISWDIWIYLESKDSMDMVGYRKLRIWANHPQPSKKADSSKISSWLKPPVLWDVEFFALFCSAVRCRQNHKEALLAVGWCLQELLGAGRQTRPFLSGQLEIGSILSAGKNVFGVRYRFHNLGKLSCDHLDPLVMLSQLATRLY